MIRVLLKGMKKWNFIFDQFEANRQLAQMLADFDEINKFRNKLHLLVYTLEFLTKMIKQT